jgi:hypothetical protein
MKNREMIATIAIIIAMLLVILISGLFAWGYYVADAPEWVKSLTEFLRNLPTLLLDNS